MTDVKPLHEDDNRLIRRFLEGDGRAFDILVERYQQRVFNIIRHTMGAKGEAVDLAQEVFVKVYRSLSSYEQRSAFPTWLYRITVNVCLDELRRIRRSGRVAFEEISGRTEEEIAEPDDTGRIVEQRELQAIVRKAIEELPEASRVVISLRDINGLSYEEIAAILHCRVGTVKSRLFNARMKLRDDLKKYL